MVLQFLKQTHRMEPQKTLSLQVATTSAWPCSFFHVLLKLTSSSVFQCFMCGISSGRQVLLVLEVLWWFSMREALKTTSPVTKRVTGGQNSPGWHLTVSLMWKAERKTTFLIKRKLQLWKNDHKNPIEDVKVLIESTAMKHGWELALKNRLGFNSVRCTVVL